MIIFRHVNKQITHKKENEVDKKKFELKIKIDGKKSDHPLMLNIWESKLINT